MGSPPIPDRSPPRPHPGQRPPLDPASVPFSPPKRKSGGSIKGKEKVVQDGDVQGAAQMAQGAQGIGQVTYRHLLGTNNLGAANPLRVIAHVDIDAAYASMEMVRLKLDPTQPMATQQWNGLIAVNYPARAYGITRHESPAEALKKCPHLKLVHVQTYRNGDTEPGYWSDPPPSPATHKVSLDMYRKESRKILSVFQEFCPIVEKASIDESFLDLTSLVRTRLLEEYPQLRAAPPESPLGPDTPLPLPHELDINHIEWEELGNLVPRNGQKKDRLKRLDSNGTELPPSSSPSKPSTSAADQSGEPEEEDEDREPPLTWSDLALSFGAAIVSKIRAETHQRLGYTCSAGIAPNKMLAKLCSAWKKPNAQTILRHCAVLAFLRPMPFQKIRNLGGKLGNAVKETYEAETVEDLQQYTLAELQAKLGDDSGVWLWEVCRGLDFTEVEPKTNVKSMLSSKNFRPYIYHYSEVIHWLNILATELHLRLTDAREESPGLWPKTITFTHRSPTFVIRSHQSSFPFTSNLTISYIFRQAEKLLRVAIGSAAATEKNDAGGGGAIKGDTKIGPYGNIQLSFSGLERLEEGQKGIAGFFSARSKDGLASEDKKGKEKRTIPKEEDDIEILPVEPTTKKRKLEETNSAPPSPPPTTTKAKPERRRQLPTFTCERCSRTLEIPASSLPAIVAADYSKEAIREALKRIEDEERDYHLARDMVEDERKRAGWRTTSSAAASTSKAGKDGASAKVKKKKTSTSSSSSSSKPPKQQKEEGQRSLGSFFKK
ncbi:DNA-directed DNA polymerase eta [Sporobolomyces salmoneus]|uniref:DNA-directed DNA polymerase eta n=1 Tax=Sporobolomyces salmoneus TaxID=183962 RepID=UPI00317E8919